MQELMFHDLQWALRRLPSKLLQLLKDYPNKVFVGGGYVRAIVANEPINDIDIFVPSKELGQAFSEILANGTKVFATDNAFTINSFKPSLQIIHRWTYETPTDLINSFDFTIAMGTFWHDGNGWKSACHDRFYADLAAKRLFYTSPNRNEDAGGSLLRVLKFYQRGYRIPLDSFGAVIARLVRAVNMNNIQDEKHLAKILTGLLREVDPSIDPNHLAHLPSEEDNVSS
jgi:hypothetical protein